MRAAVRLLANVKPGRFLEPGDPTGLTGLFNHDAPRSALLCLYGSTLDKLKALPEHSVYRQSTEALTKHRLNIIASIKPEGYEEWSKRAAEVVQENPESFQPGGKYEHRMVAGQSFVLSRERENALAREREKEKQKALEEEDDEEDDEEVDEEEKAKDEYFAALDNAAIIAEENEKEEEVPEPVDWEPEPPLEVSKINDAETQIAGGLIEEVIQVAEGELKLVDTMLESKVWEELEDKPLPGQWDYFARDQHTPGTQEPPNK